MISGERERQNVNNMEKNTHAWPSESAHFSTASPLAHLGTTRTLLRVHIANPAAGPTQALQPHILPGQLCPQSHHPPCPRLAPLPGQPLQPTRGQVEGPEIGDFVLCCSGEEPLTQRRPRGLSGPRKLRQGLLWDLTAALHTTTPPSLPLLLTYDETLHSRHSTTKDQPTSQQQSWTRHM